MNTKTLFLLSLIFLTTAAYSSQEVVINAGLNTHSVTVLSSDIVSTIIEYQVNRYKFSELAIDGKNYTVFENLPGEGKSEEAGYPGLPRINRSLVIPDDGVMTYAVLSSEYIEINDIDAAPSKGALLRSVDPETVPYTFSEIYQKDEFYPKELVTLRKPYIVRDYRGMTVELNAFQYNPVRRILRIYTKVKIEVKKTSPGGENTLVRSAPTGKLDPQFDMIYRRHFVNSSALDYPTLIESGGMLIISYDNFVEEMEDFVEWKNQRGIPTEIVPVSQAGSTPTTIKAYIDNYYRSHDLVYVLLVGDAAQIPTFTANQDGDGIYSLLIGNDNYPDIFVGRFSAENTAQVQTQVERTINYEKFPNPALSWYHEGLVIGSTTGPFPDHFNEYDYTHMTIIANQLLDYNYTQVDSAYDNWCTMQMTIDFINEGRSILYYAGHGGPEGWGTSGISTAEVFQLTNSNMLPHIVSVGCNTGQFENYTCLGEAWLRATHNITGEPTGAIGFYGSVGGMTGPAPLHLQDECIDLLTADSMFTMGGLCYNGAMHMMDIEPGTGEWEFKNLCIFGDPSVSLRSGTPMELSVSCNPELLLGAETFDLTVTVQGSPVKGLLVCMRNSEEYTVAVTNSSGQAHIVFSQPLSATEPMQLTISGGNAIPYITQIAVVDPSGPYLIYEDHELLDDLTGNNNDRLEFFETAELSLTVSNSGAALSGGSWAILDCSNEFVTVNRDSVWIGDIQAGASLTFERAFEFSLSPGLSNNDPVIFDLLTANNSQNWTSEFSIVCHAPEFEFSEIFVDDRITGNGDSLLSPGETAEFIVTMVNCGSFIGEDITGALSCVHPEIEILDGFYSAGDIEAGRSGNFHFTVSALPEFFPPGQYVEFIINMTGDHGFATQDHFGIGVGDAEFAPTGPDAYGYSAYDSGDFPFYTEYEWVELFPDSGGSGHRVPFTMLDELYHMQIPFEFQYYGAEYDSLTISTKGYICMGITNELEYYSSPIPNPAGPPAMICPLWGDLDPAGTTTGGNAGGVWYQYNPTGHYLVIQYNRVPWYAGVGGQFSTFEIILYDPEYYLTTTGDGQIKFQYKDFMAWGPTGIEDPTEVIGLEYRNGGTYPATALPLGDRAAVIFSTPRVEPEVTITMTPYLAPIIIPASGGSFQFNIALENNSGTPSFDVWAEILLPNGSIVGPTINARDVTITAGQILSRDRTQVVPATAPGGIYVYKGYIGDYPNAVAEADSFTFEKTGSTDGIAGDIEDWACYGDDFEVLTAPEIIPTEYCLFPNYPNPFNPQTTIKFALPETGEISLKVYDISGREIQSLVTGIWLPGTHQVVWDAKDCASGIYFVRLEAGNYAKTGKIVLVK